MRKEYDFSKGERGKFFRPDAELNLSGDIGVAAMTSYEHTQRGWLHHIGFAVAAAMLIGAWLARGEAWVAVLNLAVAAVLVTVHLMFGSLCVRDEGEWLRLRYGPLPLFRKRIRYADITAVQPDKTKIIDGWGIHYVPGRGWTYNLWGFGCVKLALGKKIIRVGTDDVDNLVRFLKTRLEPQMNTDEHG